MQAIRAENEKQHYLGNINVKRDGVAQRYTHEEMQEYMKCSFDPAYFARNYCKVIHLDRGLVSFDLYPYQEEMFKHFEKNRFSVVLACRQSGKSISCVAYLLWTVLFRSEKSVVVLANKGATAREMLARMTLMLENIPFFLQPGCKALNKGSIHFSNNSKIIAESTSKSSVRGLSINLVYLDEFAFVEDAEKFYTSTYPIISSGESTKVIITSTANGVGNPFHTIWEGAVQGTNDYAPFRVDWWDVPGRDERWKEETIRNTSELQFQQEFGNTFIGNGDTLFTSRALLGLKAIPPKKTFEQGMLNVYEEPQKRHNYIMMVDVSKGRGQDFSTFNIIDISVTPFEQVATYRNNAMSPMLFPDIIYKWAKTYNNAYVVIEANDVGSVVCVGLMYELEYDNVHAESAIRSDKIGIEMNKKAKRIGCSNIKDIVEENKIKIVDKQTIREMTTFVAKGTSYEASEGNHDDLVMNLVLFGYFSTTVEFLELTDINMRNMIFEQKMKAIEEDVPPFGSYFDGAEPHEVGSPVPPNSIVEYGWSNF